MTAEKVGELPAASTTEGGDVVIKQSDGASKRAATKTAIFRDAGGDAGDVPVLNSAGAVDLADGGTGASISSIGNSQYIGTDSNGTVGAYNLPSGGGGGGGLTSVGYSNIQAGAIADEEDVLSDPSSNSKLIANATLAGLLDDYDNEPLWKPFGTPVQTNASTIPSATTWTVDIGGDGILAGVNAISYNALSTPITPATRPALFGSDCSGLPSLSGGATLYGLLVITDSEGHRWGFPVADTNLADSEAAWEKVGNSWVARGYRGDELRSSYAALRPNSLFEPFSSLAKGGPSSSVFNDEVAVARNTGKARYALRVGYNTSASRFEIFTSKSEAAYVLDDDEVKASNIDTTNAGTDGQVLVKAGDRYTYEDKGGSGPTEEDLVRRGTPARVISHTYSLDSGKSFADYDFIYVEVHEGGSQYFSPLFSHKNSVGNDERLVAVYFSNDVHLTLDIQSNTVWRIDSIGTAFGSNDGVKAIIGVKF